MPCPDWCTWYTYDPSCISHTLSWKEERLDGRKAHLPSVCTDSSKTEVEHLQWDTKNPSLTQKWEIMHTSVVNVSSKILTGVPALRLQETWKRKGQQKVIASCLVRKLNIESDNCQKSCFATLYTHILYSGGRTWAANRDFNIPVLPHSNSALLVTGAWILCFVIHLHLNRWIWWLSMNKTWQILYGV